MSDINKIINKIKRKQNENTDNILVFLELVSENNLLLDDFFIHINRKVSLVKDYVWLCKMRHKELNSSDIQKVNSNLCTLVYYNYGSWSEFKKCAEIYKNNIKENKNGKINK